MAHRLSDGMDGSVCEAAAGAVCGGEGVERSGLKDADGVGSLARAPKFTPSLPVKSGAITAIEM